MTEINIKIEREGNGNLRHELILSGIDKISIGDLLMSINSVEKSLRDEMLNYIERNNIKPTQRNIKQILPKSAKEIINIS